MKKVQKFQKSLHRYRTDKAVFRRKSQGNYHRLRRTFSSGYQRPTLFPRSRFSKGINTPPRKAFSFNTSLRQTVTSNCFPTKKLSGYLYSSWKKIETLVFCDITVKKSETYRLIKRRIQRVLHNSRLSLELRSPSWADVTFHVNVRSCTADANRLKQNFYRPHHRNKIHYPSFTNPIAVPRLYPHSFFHKAFLPYPIKPCRNKPPLDTTARNSATTYSPQ